MGNRGIGRLAASVTRRAVLAGLLVLLPGPGGSAYAAVAQATASSMALQVHAQPRQDDAGSADGAARGTLASAGSSMDAVISALPGLLLLLAMVLLHRLLFYLLRRRRMVQHLPKLTDDARMSAEEEDSRSAGLDSLLNDALKRWGIHVFFGSIYAILGLYLLASWYGDEDSPQYVVAALGPLLTVASIYFVVRQLRRNEEAVWATTVDQVHARMHDIHRIFLDAPELRGYFYDGLPAPGPAASGTDNARLATKARVMAEMICDYFEQIIWHSRHLPTQQARAGWRVFMMRMFQDSPTLRQHMKAHRSMYPRELIEIAGVAAPGPVAILVDDPQSPWLARGHAVLAEEFGPRGEMETLDQLRKRLCPVHERSRDGYHVTYEMMLLVDDDNAIIGAGDYCVIVRGDMGKAQRPDRPVVGFLSHLWIAPGHRRRSLTRRILERLEALVGCDGQDGAGARVLVAEVDPPRPGDREREQRLEYFRRVGYAPVPGVAYLQPDFNADGGGGASVPVPLLLLLRRLGRAAEGELSGAQLRHVVESLYAMYARSVDERHIAAVRASLAGYPAPDAVVRFDATKPAPPPPASTSGTGT